MFFNKSKKPKPFRLNGTGTAGLLFAAIMIPIFGGVAYTSLVEAVPNLVMTFAYAAATIGATARFIMQLDNWAVTRFIEGRAGPVSRFITEQLWDNPLRFMTLNQLAKNLDDHWLNDELKSLRKQKKTHDKETATLAIQDNRTVKYLLKVTDPRKHMREVGYLALSLFSGLRMLSLFAAPAQKFSPGQIGGRLGGYLFGVAFSVAHLDAWVQRRSAEENASPFFALSNRVLVRTPLRPLGRQLIRWDYHRAQNVMTGRQGWAWRKRHAVYSQLPGSWLRRHFISGLETKKLLVTPAVQEAIIENGTTHRLAAMEKILSGEPDKLAKQEPLPTWTDWKTAARDMMCSNRERAKRTMAAFQNYAERARQRQQARPPEP